MIEIDEQTLLTGQGAKLEPPADELSVSTSAQQCHVINF